MTQEGESVKNYADFSVSPGVFHAQDRMLKWFEYQHLPEHLQRVSMRFYEIASSITEDIASGPERTVALRKLLEAKDAAVRAKLHPGG